MSTYGRIVKYVIPYKKHLLTAIFCTILFAFFNAATVYLSIPLVETLFQDAGSSAASNNSDSFLSKLFEGFTALILSGSKTEALVKICFVILSAFFLKNLFGYLQSYFLAAVQQGMIKDIRNKAYIHLNNLSLGYFKKNKTGDLISRITNDVLIIQDSISAFFINLIREPFTIAALLFIVVSINWKLTLFTLIILPLTLSAIIWLGLKLRKQSKIIQEKISSVTTVLLDAVSGIKIVKAFRAETHMRNKFSSQTENYFLSMIKLIRIRNLTGPVTEFLSVIIAVVIIFYGGDLVLNKHEMKPSEFLGFIFAIFQMMRPIKELSSVSNRIHESSAAADRVFEINDSIPEVKELPGAESKLEFNDSILFRDVCFTYGDSNLQALKNINAELHKGEKIALVGSSGAGKTTFADLIPRFYDVTQGSILLDGIDIKNLKISDLRNLIGIVTQEIVLFNGTVAENIAYGNPANDKEKIIEAAKIANAHSFIKNLPEGYDTQIGEKGLKLSGGQRQRLSIARAIFKNPPILIMDEATASLDSDSEKLVQEAIEKVLRNRTAIVIAHRLSTIINSDRIFVLEKGEIVQKGTNEELLKDENGIYKKLYELQFAGT